MKHLQVKGFGSVRGSKGLGVLGIISVRFGSEDEFVLFCYQVQERHEEEGEGGKRRKIGKKKYKKKIVSIEWPP